MIKNIYLAGKIDKNDWRNDLVKGLRATLSGSCFPDPDESWPILKNAVLNSFNYTGPYFVSYDHGCFHGANTHGVSAQSYDHDSGIHMQEWTVARCQAAIQQSDLVIAWIDCETCYGTLTEIGYAKALGKRIWIVGLRSLPDLWFAYQMADECQFSTRFSPAEAINLMLLRDRAKR